MTPAYKMHNKPYVYSMKFYINSKLEIKLLFTFDVAIKNYRNRNEGLRAL